MHCAQLQAALLVLLSSAMVLALALAPKWPAAPCALAKALCTANMFHDFHSSRSRSRRPSLLLEQKQGQKALSLLFLFLLLFLFSSFADADRAGRTSDATATTTAPASTHEITHTSAAARLPRLLARPRGRDSATTAVTTASARACLHERAGAAVRPSLYKDDRASAHAHSSTHSGSRGRTATSAPTTARAPRLQTCGSRAPGSWYTRHS